MKRFPRVVPHPVYYLLLRLLYRGTLRSFEMYWPFRVERSFRENYYYEKSNVNFDRVI